MMQDLVKKSRSFRRFQEERPIEEHTLVSLIELARLIPSAHNMQPLKYVLSHTRERNELIFSTLKWAVYLKDWPGPAEGEHPAGYVVILGDREISESVPWDYPIAAQTIALGAAEIGLGACILASIDKKRLAETVKIPARYQIFLVVALGYPKETVVIDEMREGNFKYWRDDAGVHHVPKRNLKELILDLQSGRPEASSATEGRSL
ncbi:MAG: nitroreductase family protein [Syntrophorhabdales bacterium]|jgi:nitroreductase